MDPVRSLRDLARRLKLSPATVSLALNGYAQVAEATRQKVLAGAMTHGYRPNAALAQSLSRRKGQVHSLRNTVSIAYLRSTPQAGGDGIPHWTLSLRGLQVAAERRGFTVEDINIHDHRSPRHLLRTLYHRGFRALVLGTFMERIRFRPEDLAPFAVVAVGRHDVSPRVHVIRRDEAACIRLLCQKLLQQGHQRPGFCLMRHEPLLNDDRDRLGAWMTEAEADPMFKRVPPFLGNLTADNDAEALVRWYHLHRPDIVVGFHSGHHWALHQAGVRIPSACAYLQMHVAAWEKHYSGCSDYLADFGRHSLPMIERLLSHGELGVPRIAHDVVLQPEWVEAASPTPDPPR